MALPVHHVGNPTNDNLATLSMSLPQQVIESILSVSAWELHKCTWEFSYILFFIYE